MSTVEWVLQASQRLTYSWQSTLPETINVSKKCANQAGTYQAKDISPDEKELTRWCAIEKTEDHQSILASTSRNKNMCKKSWGSMAN